MLHNGEVVSAALPELVELEIASAGPTMKTERADGRMLKVAQLKNGATVQASARAATLPCPGPLLGSRR